MKRLMFTFLAGLALVQLTSAQNLPATEYYANGQCKAMYEKASKGQIKLSRFHSNGKLAEEGMYLNGKPDGRWQTWDQDGNTTAELNYTNGKRNGEFRVYDRTNGTVTEVAYNAGAQVASNQWVKGVNLASNHAK